MVNVGEGSRQTSFVTSGDGLAPGVGLQAFTINALRLLKFSSGLVRWNGVERRQFKGPGISVY